MGLLKPADWLGNWVSDPILADPANRPRTPINCYRSLIAHSPDTYKSITVDLGEVKTIDGVRFTPSRPDNTTWDYRTLMYPVRFKVDATPTRASVYTQCLVDKSKEDVLAPRSNGSDTEIYRFEKFQARYVRLIVSKLALWDGNDYALSIAKFQVFDGDTDIAVGARVFCSDSVESGDYSSKFLTDPSKKVAYSALPSALLPHMGGIDSVSRVPLMRRDFTAFRPITRATFYAAGRGFYELSLNGKRVGSDLLSGGYTEFDRRLQYQTYDVTDLLSPGKNSIGLMLGYGWYAGRMNLWKNQYIHGFFPQFLGQLELEYSDGIRETVVTDGEWKSTLDGACRWSDILDGEGYDCRKEIHGWNLPTFDAQQWSNVAVFPKGTVPLIWQRAQPVKKMEEITPIGMKLTAPNTYVFDMGQEISGWCRLKVDGPSGTFIKLRHAEKRNADGSLNPENLWDTSAEEDYILDGNGPRTLEPHFTWHGFRFVEVTGLPKPPSPGDIIGIHVRTEAKRVGHLETSNPLFNKLITASRWTEQNMLFDVPAGCAGRSERVGWAGDVRPCVHTALYHFDSTAFLEKYAADMRTDQTDDGRFTDISPHAHLEGTSICVGSPGWADAGVSLSWDLYQHTGDTSILSNNYAAACRWVDFISSNNPDFIWSNALGQAWGDWLSAGPATPMPIGATAFYANDADILSKIAVILGNDADAVRYSALFKNIRAAFVSRFVSLNGIISDSHPSGEENKLGAGGRTDVEGSYALALRFNLLDEPLRGLAMQRLLELIGLNGGHTTTGFWTSVELLKVLSDNGSHAVASRMMNLTSQPSWGYMVQGDGSTCWESFDADSHSLSLNHWTHSAIGEWFWRYIAGVATDPASPGFRSVIIRPRPSAEVNWCKATLDSIRGPISISWAASAKGFRLDLGIPANVTATVYIPAAQGQNVREGNKPAATSPGVKILRKEADTHVYRIGSGVYQFAVS
jgi:hypothetical protein